MSDLEEIFDPQGVSSHPPLFGKNHFPVILGGHLEFLHETKNTFISETVRDRAILTIFLTCRVYAESSGSLCQKSFSCYF